MDQLPLALGTFLAPLFYIKFQRQSHIENVWFEVLIAYILDNVWFEVLIAYILDSVWLEVLIAYTLDNVIFTKAKYMTLGPKFFVAVKWP